MHVRRLILLSFAAVLNLQACAPAPIERALNRWLDPVDNIDANQAVALTNGMGMIVGSVTAPKVEHYWEISTIYYRKFAESEYGQLRSASPVSNAFWQKDRPVEPGGIGPDPGLEAQLGRLFAIELSAGEYEIFRICFGHTCLQLEPAQFEVSEGEIRYVGNVDVRYCLYAPKLRVYRGRVHGAIPRVRDEASRDLALLRRKFPALQGSEISKSIIDDTVWHDLAVPFDSVCPKAISLSGVQP
jgi:hypothetical protein